MRIFREVQQIMGRLQDEESRCIFRHRLNYLTDGDPYHLIRMVEESQRGFHPPKVIHDMEMLWQADKSQLERGVVVYGTGMDSGPATARLKEYGVPILAYCDGDPTKQGKAYGDIMIISPEQLRQEHKTDIVVVATQRYMWEICDNLISWGFDATQLYQVGGLDYPCYNYVDTPQYFGPSFIQPVEDSKLNYSEIGWSFLDTVLYCV